MYSLEDLNDFFYKKTLEEMEEQFEKMGEVAKLFNKDVVTKVKPVITYDPINKDEKEFPFPLAVEIRKLYGFCTGKYDAIIDIKEVLKTLKKMMTTNWLGESFVKISTNEEFLEKRLGFMIVLARKRIKLANGEDLSAHDLAILVGITGQGIVNNINRGYLEAEKIGNTWSIENDVARDFIRNRKHPFYSVVEHLV